MKKPTLSTKRVAIDKAQTQMVIAVGIAAFISVFALVAAHALWGQKGYLGRVTAEKEKAHKQLQANVKAVDSLVTAYKAFVSTSTNAIGGNSGGNGDNDGDNAKIILDALPPQYDFPGLASSLEKVLGDRGFSVGGIGGTDDQLTQQTNTSSPSPQAVIMPFTFSVINANYGSVQNLISVLQKSIRPIQIDKLELSGATNSMQLVVTAHTYYQPAKNLKITTKEVK
ncbi:MAG TPA: hypothetical protein VLG37_03495 [Candidatus Saccharimonadales bacterium]|nr:hypothetical protein [Candidatus Saccharimonadales bacterium]